MTAVWRILVLRRKTVVVSVVICLVLAAGVSACMPARYAAASRIEINAENAAALDVTVAPAGNDAEYAVTLATQQEVLESDTLALEVIRQLRLEEVEKQRTPMRFLDSGIDSTPLEQSSLRRTQALKRFHRNLSVEVLGGTRIVQVVYKDRDPATAAAVVNALVNDYLEQYFQTRYTATRQASDWLSGQLATLKHDVASSEERLAEYQRRTGILGESETNNIVMAKLEDVNRQLSAAEANRIVREAVWQLAKSGDPELISSVAGTSFVQGVSAAPNSSQLGLLPNLRAQEAQLKADIAQTASRLGPNFPKLVQMRAQLAELETSIDGEVSKISARAENDYLAAKHAEDMERELFDRQKAEANKLNSSAVEYGILKREADARQDLYQAMVGKLKQAGLLAGLRSSNIVVVDPARPPAKPASPDTPLNLLIGLAIGVLGGAGIALLQDGTDSTIRTPEDLHASSGLPIMGILPLVRDKEHGATEAAERFRSLRTSLLLSEPQRARVIVVTSALAEEGKSTITANLARAFARQGERVLQIDADLRKSSVRFDFVTGMKSPGLTDILSEPDAQTPEQPWLMVDGVHVIAAGEPPPFPSELLGSPKMAKLMKEWREQFDRILIDTPPVLSFTDAVLLANLADIALLVVNAGSTSSEAVLRCAELLRVAKPAALAGVLNRMDFQSPRYKHYYGHAYARPQLQEHKP